MPHFWLLQQSTGGLERYFDLADRDGSGSLVANRLEVFTQNGSHGALQVVPRLAIGNETFDLDLFEDGMTFMSARLITAMALPAEALRLGEVDDSACCAAVRGVGYRTVELQIHGDVIDEAASDGEVIEWTDASGARRREWHLATPTPNRPAPKLRWRMDSTPPVELFLVKGAPWRVATDALAGRVLAVGAKGLDFVDPIASAATGDLVTRPA